MAAVWMMASGRMRCTMSANWFLASVSHTCHSTLCGGVLDARRETAWTSQSGGAWTRTLPATKPLAPVTNSFTRLALSFCLAPDGGLWTQNLPEFLQRAPRQFGG